MNQFPSEEKNDFWCRRLWKSFQIALENDEIFIGCVVVKDGQIIGRKYNAREEL